MDNHTHVVFEDKACIEYIWPKERIRLTKAPGPRCHAAYRDQVALITLETYNQLASELT